MARIAVCIPITHSMCSRFAISMLSLPSELKKFGHEPIYLFDETPMFDTRNNLSQSAQAHNPDYLLWLDSDMEFKGKELAEWIQQVIDDKCDMATGIYYKRRFPDYGATIFKLVGSIAYEILDHPKERFLVDRCGFGCVLIRADIAKKIYNTTKGSPFLFDGSQGEDFYFCAKYQAEGYVIWAYPNLNLGHDGIYKWHYDRYRKSQAEALGLTIGNNEFVLNPMNSDLLRQASL